MAGQADAGGEPTSAAAGTAPGPASPMSVSPPEQLFEEAAFVAYHFNWSQAEVLEMPHWERRRWCEEISRINERINEAGEP